MQRGVLNPLLRATELKGLDLCSIQTLKCRDLYSQITRLLAISHIREKLQPKDAAVSTQYDLSLADVLFESISHDSEKTMGP